MHQRKPREQKAQHCGGLGTGGPGPAPHPTCCLRLPLLTFWGFVHRVPELEACGVLIPQFLQLRPQQDVLLSLWGDRAQESGGMVAGIALGDTPHPTARHPVTHGPPTWPSSQEHRLAELTRLQESHPLLISPQERTKATGEDVHYKRSYKRFLTFWRNVPDIMGSGESRKQNLRWESSIMEQRRETRRKYAKIGIVIIPRGWFNT